LFDRKSLILKKTFRAVT